MLSLFQINPQLDIPIYQQLVDQIRSAVKSGTLKSGQQLPTVQEVAHHLDVAKGTVKRAYDELERLDLVEKVQGRGTFVSYRPADPGSHKEQAMAAIDKMLDTLEGLGFSPAEVNIFLDLKLRQRAQQEARVKIAVLECNPENLAQMSDQLRAIPHVELFSYLVSSIEEYPYKLDEDIDLIITTVTHAQDLENVLGTGKRVTRVALRLSPACLLEILRLPKGSTLGILSSSPRFGHLLETTCTLYAEDVCVAPSAVFSTEQDTEEFLKGKDALLLPRGYEKYCSPRTLAVLKNFDGTLIECSYELDEGSFLYLQEKAKRLLQAKAI